MPPAIRALLQETPPQHDYRVVDLPFLRPRPRCFGAYSLGFGRELFGSRSWTGGRGAMSFTIPQVEHSFEWGRWLHPGHRSCRGRRGSSRDGFRIHLARARHAWPSAAQVAARTRRPAASAWTSTEWFATPRERAPFPHGSLLRGTGPRPTSPRRRRRGGKT